MVAVVTDVVLLLFCHVTKMSRGGKWNQVGFRSRLDVETQMMTPAPRLSVTLSPFHRWVSPRGHKMATVIPSFTSSPARGKREKHSLQPQHF